MGPSGSVTDSSVKPRGCESPLFPFPFRLRFLFHFLECTLPPLPSSPLRAIGPRYVVFFAVFRVGCTARCAAADCAAGFASTRSSAVFLPALQPLLCGGLRRPFPRPHNPK